MSHKKKPKLSQSVKKHLKEDIREEKEMIKEDKKLLKHMKKGR